jgi:hypothetical protein
MSIFYVYLIKTREPKVASMAWWDTDSPNIKYSLTNLFDRGEYIISAINIFKEHSKRNDVVLYAVKPNKHSLHWRENTKTYQAWEIYYMPQ